MDMTGAPREVYIGCHGDLAGCGGAVTAGRGLAAACERAGVRALLLGMGEHRVDLPDTPEGSQQQNVVVTPRPVVWRVHNWCIPRILAAHLRRLVRPRAVFVSFSPFWPREIIFGNF